jgi:D-alanyl-D-alanine carboxypeptidase
MVEGGEFEYVSLQATETVSLLLSSEERKRLEIWPQIPAQTGAPVKAKQKLGTLEYWLDGKMLKQVALQTEFAVPEQSIFSSLTGMITNLSGTN